jgi:hypothetical protein
MKATWLRRGGAPRHAHFFAAPTRLDQGLPLDHSIAKDLGLLLLQVLDQTILEIRANQHEILDDFPTSVEATTREVGERLLEAGPDGTGRLQDLEALPSERVQLTSLKRSSASGLTQLVPNRASDNAAVKPMGPAPHNDTMRRPLGSISPERIEVPVVEVKQPGLGS